MTPPPAVACAESIALLSILHAIPERPSKNQIDASHVRQDAAYTLPFEKERRLTATLAFLSSVSDDSNHVTAVCVEEDSQSGTLNVLLAINKRTRDSRGPILKEIEGGFKNIFKELNQQVPDGEHHPLQQKAPGLSFAKA